MTGNKPHARAIAPSDYAEAVVFDFVNPTRSCWGRSVREGRHGSMKRVRRRNNMQHINSP
jgi:hypothetical protein